ncbi:MAG: zinc ribbon domain-containing protein [Pseudomonadota bacterium]
MPIYEFYCADCNTIFNFLSSRVNTKKRPLCPKCGQCPLERFMSMFSVLKGGRKEESDTPPMPDIDESRLEKAMSFFDKEAGQINEEDPKQASQLMRKLCDMTGLNLGSSMDEALRRMEGGEDPEKIEQEMGDLFQGDEIFDISQKGKAGGKKARPPIYDKTLYSL